MYLALHLSLSPVILPKLLLCRNQTSFERKEQPERKQEKLNWRDLMKVKILLNWWIVLRGILREVLAQIQQREYSLAFKRHVINLNYTENFKIK